MHIPDDPLFYEKFYFTPGDLGFRAWSTRHGRIGVLICWDQWYPEAARLTAFAERNPVLPNRDRLASCRKIEHGRNSTPLGNHSEGAQSLTAAMSRFRTARCRAAGG
jgi:N-carbamoylputrescine amidase